MEINGKIHCFFEKSGTFKNEFKKLGYEAYDYDILNNFGETDFVIDLFEEIEEAYRGGQSVFDKIGKDDLILAFYPCIYFCESSQCAFRIWHSNYRTWEDEAKIAKILEREKKRSEFYSRLIRLVGVCLKRNLRIVIENPWSGIGYLRNNFLKDPDIIDMDRTKRGDYFKKPTAFWFFNCEAIQGRTLQQTPKDKIKTIRTSKSGAEAGLCSEDRSMISSDYARNFICDNVLGKKQNLKNQQLTIF